MFLMEMKMENVNKCRRIRRIRKIFYWFIGFENYVQRSHQNRFVLKVAVTAKSRFNAELRLKYLDRITFLTTTLMSLGMIFIPLIQYTEIKLGYPPKVLDMLQVFFAVSVLVYSVICSTANYKHRALLLNQCGNKLKHLQAKALSSSEFEKNKESFATEYENILNSSDGHEEVDYQRTKLQMNEYNVTGLKWCWYHLNIFVHYAKVSAIPIIMFSLEVIIIIDTLFHCKIIKPFCNM